MYIHAHILKNTRMCDSLLRRGATLNTQNHKGHTPLHFCFTYGFTDLGEHSPCFHVFTQVRAR